MLDRLSFEEKENVLNYLKAFVTDDRNKRFEEVIKYRTKHLTVVLEDIYQPHNASAVLRSCDCFGIQDVHIIENSNSYSVNPQVALGASKWLNLYKYNQQDFNTPDCINSLKKSGYKVIATTPHEDGADILDMDVDEKLALMFGTEMHGLTPTALSMADGYVKIPMYGFTESLNISVTVAICLFYFSEEIRKSDKFLYLSPEEKLDTLLLWYQNTIKSPQLILEKYFSK